MKIVARLLSLLPLLWVVGVMPVAAVESTPPTLDSFTITPTEVNVSSQDQTITFTVEASDESEIDWAESKVEFNSPSGQSNYPRFSDTAPHIATWTISSSDPSGQWEVGYVRLLDEHGNRKNYYAVSGELDGFETTVQVQGGVESTPPTLDSFTITPTEVNVSSQDQTITFTVEASDESEIDWAESKVEFNSPSGQSNYPRFSDTAPHIATWTISSSDPSGQWEVGYVRLLDEHGNRKNYYAVSGELDQAQTSILLAFVDTDSDGVDDCSDTDDDNDGLTDTEETGFGTDPLKHDTDGDGWSDKEEVDGGTDPLLPTSQPELENGLPIWLLYQATQ